MKIDLFLTPYPLERAYLSSKTVVAIDVLRSSTSTCAALRAGARGVIPTSGPGEAAELWTKIGTDMAILVGERDGVKIENFQLGNSPQEFTPETVGGKYVIMTTTNGTAVYNKTQDAALVLCGALVNISKVAQRVAQENRDLVIVCSGHEGGFSIEDTICAGMLIYLLKETCHITVEINDAASLALLLYQANQSSLMEIIQRGEHGRRLADLSFGDDVIIAAQPDTIPVLPVLVDGRLVIDNSDKSD